MADFDDLIPKSSNENPFSNPFADVGGRPRSPDPWSMGASYYEQQTQPFDSDADVHPAAGWPSSSAIEGEPISISRSPFSATPPASSSVLPPHDVYTHDEPLEPSEPQQSLLTPPLQALTIKNEESSQVTEIPPLSSPPSAAAPENSPSASGPLEVPSETPAPQSYSTMPLHTPLQTESPDAPSPDRRPTPRSNEAPVSGPPDLPTLSPATSMPTPISPLPAGLKPNPFEQPVYSPLSTPLSHPAPASFNGLALGGEVAGWGHSSQPIMPTHQAHRPSADAAAGGDYGDDDDDDDDRPLGTPRTSTVPQDPHQGIDASQTLSSSHSIPRFEITVGDPQKVGDPINAHIVYTVSTKTNASQYKKASFSVLRRYSDFLWLVEALALNNPGVIIPPVPEKMPFGRFAEQFVESRRLALNRCIQKIANHAQLAMDPDLQLFLESDSFALDIKHRSRENERGGIMATIGNTITGPKFYETDEWFDKKKVYLDALESQLKGLAKAFEVVAKQRAETLPVIGELAEALSVLGSSDLSKQLSSSLTSLADLERKSRDMMEQHTKHDLETVLGTVDEYLRMIASVRLAFTSRQKLFYAWKAAEAEMTRVRSTHEKTLRQRGMDRQSILPLQREIESADGKAHDARSEFEKSTKLIKAEVARFEHERVMEFKVSLEAFLDGMITQQNEIIEAWEGYQHILLRRVGPAAQAN